METWNAEGLLRPPALFETIAPGAWVTWTSMLFRSKILSNIGGLDTAVGYTADVDLILRAALGARPCYRRGRARWSLSTPGSASARYGLQVLESHLGLTEFRKIEHAILRAGEDGIFSEISRYDSRPSTRPASSAISSTGH